MAMNNEDQKRRSINSETFASNVPAMFLFTIFGQAAVQGSEAMGPNRRLWREQSRQELRTRPISRVYVSRTTETVGIVILNTFAPPDRSSAAWLGP